MRVEASKPTEVFNGIFICGEAPGEQEEKEGAPFVGAAGRTLDGILEECGIRRGGCYITNYVKERPLHNNFSSVPKEDLAKYKAELLEEISVMRPNIVVALGEHAFSAITGLKGITHWRGSIIDVAQTKVLGTIHPAAILREWKFRPMVVCDLTRAKGEAGYPDIRRLKRNLIINPTHADVLRFLQDILDKCLPCAFDIETETSQICCIAFATSPTLSICIPFWFGASGSIYSEKAELEIWKKIKEVLEDPDIRKIAQNAQYDMTILRDKYGINVKGLWLDTMIAFHAVYPELPKGLDFLTSIYTDVPYYKYYRKTNDMDDFFRYNATDAAVTYECAKKIYLEMEEANVVDFYYEHMHSLIEPLMDICNTGVLIDTEDKQIAIEEMHRQLINLQEQLNKLVGHVLNVNSPKQMKAWLYNELKLKPKFKLRKAKGEKTISADEDALEELFTETHLPALKVVLDIREARKLLSTYLEVTYDKAQKVYLHETELGQVVESRREYVERARTSYLITGTETGRLSSRETVYGTGCLLPSAEVLTPNGWVALSKLPETVQVLQWNPEDNSLDFAESTLFKTIYRGPLIGYDSTFHHNYYTPEHTIPYIQNTRNKFFPLSARKTSNHKSWRLPVGGVYKGSFTSCTLIRLIVAVQADGCIEDNIIRMSFKKSRKIKRFKELAKNAGITYSTQKPQKGLTRFCIGVVSSTMIIDLLNKCGHKTFGAWLLDLDKESLEAFVDETKYWDSHRRGNSWVYATTVKENADWVATCAHLTNRSSSVSVIKDNNRGYGKGANKILYSVNIKPRNKIRIEQKHLVPSEYFGEVYCVTTQTGYFLCKFDGKIVITGNTNMQNIPKGIVRRIFIPDEGKVFVHADLSQAEARVVAWLAGEDRLIKIFQDGGDVHRRNAAKIFRKAEGDVTSQEREIAKRVLHATNYGMGPITFSRNAGVSVSEAKRLLNAYFAEFPRIKLWHMSIQRDLRNTRTLTTPLGRRRTFFNRWDDSLLREGLAYIPQSTVADLLNMGLRRVYEKTKGSETQILLQIHDAILCQTPLVSVKETAGMLRETLSIPIRIGVQVLTIPVDISVGVSWDRLEKYIP